MLATACCTGSSAARPPYFSGSTCKNVAGEESSQCRWAQADVYDWLVPTWVSPHLGIKSLGKNFCCIFLVNEFYFFARDRVYERRNQVPEGQRVLWCVLPSVALCSDACMQLMFGQAHVCRLVGAAGSPQTMEKVRGLVKVQYAEALHVVLLQHVKHILESGQVYIL